MNDQLNIDFGDALRKQREARSLTQEQFAIKCGISRAYYGRIERGEHSATINQCGKIAAVLGLHIAQLFEDMPF